MTTNSRDLRSIMESVVDPINKVVNVHVLEVLAGIVVRGPRDSRFVACHRNHGQRTPSEEALEDQVVGLDCFDDTGQSLFVMRVAPGSHLVGFTYL